MRFRAVARAITPPIILSVAKAMTSPRAAVQPSRYYDDFYASSVEYAKPYPESIYYPIWAVVADRLVRGKASSVLDLGCGPGQFAELLRDKGIANYCGIDFSAVSIEQAKKRCPGYEFVQTDLAEFAHLGFDHDWVVALEVLEHVENDLAVVEQINSGAHVLLTVPNFRDPAHVHVFASPDDVNRRYAGLLKATIVDRFKHGSGGQELFLVEGQRV